MKLPAPVLTWYRRLSVRERGLMLLIVWVALLAWLFAVIDAFGPELKAFQRDARTLTVQERKIATAEPVLQAYRGAIAQIDSSKTYGSPSALQGRVDDIARRESRMQKFEVRITQSESNDLFNNYHVRLSVDQASLEELIAFDEIIKAESPYLTLTAFTLRALPRDPRKLDATFEIGSFQLKTEALQPAQ